MTDESPKPPPMCPAQKIDGVLVFDPRGYVTADLPDEPPPVEGPPTEGADEPL